MFARETIVEMATDAMFGRPLVVNVFRSTIVEAIVAAALADWRWCSTDYASYDFEHPDGTRLEVKQTAPRQSWASLVPPRPSWDIRARTGYWVDGAKWVDSPGRNADIYALAIHSTIDQTADHRDPAQWEFFVIAATALPPTQRLGLARARQLSECTAVEDLAQRVERARLALRASHIK